MSKPRTTGERERSASASDGEREHDGERERDGWLAQAGCAAQLSLQGRSPAGR